MLPAHEVDNPVVAYYIGVTEVTVSSSDLFVEQTGYVTDAQKQGWAFSQTEWGCVSSTWSTGAGPLRADRPRARRRSGQERRAGVLSRG